VIKLQSEQTGGLGINAEVIKVQDIETIPDYQVLAVPALTLDRVVKVAGEVPKVEEIKDWIKWKGG
jgi:hypothetical protein